MYRNLLSEVVKAGLTKEIMAKKLSLPVNSFVERLTGKKDFYLDECLKIQSELNDNLALEYLFECD